MEDFNLQTTGMSDVIPHFIVVNKGSKESVQNGSVLYPFKTIQQAINSIRMNPVHKDDVTILIQPSTQGTDDSDWTYEENLTRPYSVWIKFKGSVQPSIDVNAPFDSYSTNRMIRIKGNINLTGGLNLFENLDLSNANLNILDSSLDIVSCRIGNITKTSIPQTNWYRIKDCRGSGLITMNSGYLLLDNFINCADNKDVNININGGYGIKILNSSGINLQTTSSSIKPYVEAINTYFKGLNIQNASYVSLLGGGLTERLNSTYPTYGIGGIRIAQGIPYSTTMFSYDPYKSVI